MDTQKKTRAELIAKCADARAAFGAKSIEAKALHVEHERKIEARRLFELQATARYAELSFDWSLASEAEDDALGLLVGDVHNDFATYAKRAELISLFAGARERRQLAQSQCETYQKGWAERSAAFMAEESECDCECALAGSHLAELSQAVRVAMVELAEHLILEAASK